MRLDLGINLIEVKGLCGIKTVGFRMDVNYCASSPSGHRGILRDRQATVGISFKSKIFVKSTNV